ncbi:MAG: ATP-binding cassette domain-containing protein [Gemmatimonadota bacterium]
MADGSTGRGPGTRRPHGAEEGEPGGVERSDGAAIRARDLTRTFGDFVAVDAVSFEVGEGEIFGFLGPNGAGKTTTIKMLIGLLPPTSGQAWVTGLDVRGAGPRLRQRIGYMSQLFSLYPDLTVDENIELFAGLFGVTGNRFDERRRWVLDMGPPGSTPWHGAGSGT